MKAELVDRHGNSCSLCDSKGESLIHQFTGAGLKIRLCGQCMGKIAVRSPVHHELMEAIKDYRANQFALTAAKSCGHSFHCICSGDRLKQAINVSEAFNESS